MTVTFKSTQLESTASPLYKVEAIDEDGNVLMTWQIAVNDGDDLDAIALEAYTQATTPKSYETPKEQA